MLGGRDKVFVGQMRVAGRRGSSGLSHAEQIGAMLALSGMISWVFALLRPLLLWRAARITS